MRALRLLTLGLLGALGCESSSAAPPTRFWSLFDLVDSFQRGGSVAAQAIPYLPGGLPAERFVTRVSDNQLGLPVRYGFSEGLPAAYISAEVWSRQPAVWIQPMYVLVTGWDAQSGAWIPLLDGGVPARPIFSVGPGSGFASAFWRVYYAVVPPGTPLDKYRSSRQILDDGLPLHSGPGRLCVMAPPGLVVDKSTEPARTLLAVPGIGEPAFGSAWVDGRDQPVAVLDFGTNRFTWNDRLEVEEQPLFLFFARDSQGAWTFTGLPNVGGTGPLFAGRAALGPANRPAFGSLWRLYAVELPAGSLVVLPTNAPDGFPTAASLEALGLRVKAAEPTATGPGEWDLKVATRDCPGDQLAQCVFLDAQSRIEAALPGAIRRTEVLVTCPLVNYAGAPVR